MRYFLSYLTKHDARKGPHSGLGTSTPHQSPSPTRPVSLHPTREGLPHGHATERPQHRPPPAAQIDGQSPCAPRCCSRPQLTPPPPQRHQSTRRSTAARVTLPPSRPQLTAATSGTNRRDGQPAVRATLPPSAHAAAHRHHQRPLQIRAVENGEDSANVGATLTVVDLWHNRMKK